MPKERWEDVGRIYVLYNKENEIYAARIRKEGLTAYGKTYEEAVTKLLLLKEAKEKAD